MVKIDEYQEQRSEIGDDASLLTTRSKSSGSSLSGWRTRRTERRKRRRRCGGLRVETETETETETGEDKSMARACLDGGAAHDMTRWVVVAGWMKRGSRKESRGREVLTMREAQVKETARARKVTGPRWWKRRLAGQYYVQIGSVQYREVPDETTEPLRDAGSPAWTGQWRLSSIDSPSRGNLSPPKGPWNSSKSRRPAQPQDVLDAVFPANWVKFDSQATASNLDLSRAVEGVSKGEGEPEGASNMPPVADGRRYIS
ncbi:uncharacterized protein CLUP02_12936 [Colletotrichum lupini]|uniref:Uncharacterized protein n=1 Tax=Colletotrichum lupini TaxID=145971 RepID=A0A9Q8T3A1_9PEZI|nr:uncharacterized protein CLUP02_12936 [Colletotrichum lupini]UQC87431.1 hypothetical protein CLUP02_12936 [Colletotrichum lupini]